MILPALRRPAWRYGTAIFALIGGMLGAATYLLTPYETLRDWYLGLNSCFYQVDSWTKFFFTPTVKAQGNFLCGLALGLCSLGISGLIYRWRRAVPAQLAVALPTRFPRLDALYYLILIAVSSGLWWWGSAHVVPGPDEVFSALYCAQVPGFQTVAYYMLPNNHVFFNFLNGAVFGNTTYNLVATGRLLSGLAYLATVAGIYTWFRQLTRQRHLAALVALTAALQFSLWGFGFQARGYALYALAHWGAFIGLFGYLRQPRGSWLLLNALGCVIGYATVPTFLYFHAAQLAFGGIYQLVKGKADWRFWRYQAGIVLATYLFYLPALCFSGLDAFTSNDYVRPARAEFREFLPLFGRAILIFIEYCFSDIKLAGISLSYGLALLPLLLLRAQRTTVWFAYGLFYALLLVTLGSFMLGMRRSPFPRNLTGHCSLTFALVPATLYWLFEQLPVRRHSPRWQLGGIVALLFALGRQFVANNPIAESNRLYDSDNSTVYNAIEADLRMLPAGRSVTFSWQSFYVYHAGQQRGLRCYQPCEPVQADYYITQPTEQLPVTAAPYYELVQEATHYHLYQRR